MRPVRRSVAGSLVACCLTLLPSGCESAAVEPDLDRQKVLSDQIVDGTTTREQVLMRFGEPSGIYEAGRIHTYRMAVGADGTVTPVARELVLENRDQWHASWEQAMFSLVLIYDPSHRVVRHSVVAMK